MTTIRTYKTYNFNGRDPILRTLMGRIEKLKISDQEIENRSGVTCVTLWRWRNHKTMRPRFATIAAVVHAIGDEITVRPRRVANGR